MCMLRRLVAQSSPCLPSHGLFGCEKEGTASRPYFRTKRPLQELKMFRNPNPNAQRGFMAISSRKGKYNKSKLTLRFGGRSSDQAGERQR